MNIEEILLTNPTASLIFIASLVSLVMTLFNKKFTNQSRMRELKEIQKKCNIKLKENRDNPAEIQKNQQQMMECSMEMMKYSFKPLIITLLPLLILFGWMQDFFSPLVSGWIWWYLGAAITSSIIFRKVFNVA